MDAILQELAYCSGEFWPGDIVVPLDGIAELEGIGSQFCHVPNVNKSFNNWQVNVFCKRYRALQQFFLLKFIPLRIKKFARLYPDPIFAQPVRKLPWGDIVILIQEVNNPEARDCTQSTP